MSIVLLIFVLPSQQVVSVFLYLELQLQCPSDSKVVQPKPSHEKLAKLTDLVSFLEN